jgi:hypothetical protein
MRFVMNPAAPAILHERATDVLHQYAEAIARDARAGCPVSAESEERDGPHLVETVVVEGTRVYVGDGHSPLWLFMEYGTLPHMIYPRRKAALFWPGARHPVRSVKHPGTPEFAFMRKALYQRRTVVLP